MELKKVEGSTGDPTSGTPWLCHHDMEPESIVFLLLTFKQLGPFEEYRGGDEMGKVGAQRDLEGKYDILENYY